MQRVKIIQGETDCNIVIYFHCLTYRNKFEFVSSLPTHILLSHGLHYTVDVISQRYVPFFEIHVYDRFFPSHLAR